MHNSIRMVPRAQAMRADLTSDCIPTYSDKISMVFSIHCDNCDLKSSRQARQTALLELDGSLLFPNELSQSSHLASDLSGLSPQDEQTCSSKKLLRHAKQCIEQHEFTSLGRLNCHLNCCSNRTFTSFFEVLWCAMAHDTVAATPDMSSYSKSRLPAVCCPWSILFLVLWQKHTPDKN